MPRRVRQRYKLYSAEFSVWPWEGSCTPDAAQGWYDWVVKTKWWRDHSEVHHFKVRYPVFGKLSGIVLEGDIAIVEFGPFSLVRPRMVHELGHVLDYHPGTSIEDMERDHDPKFAGILLALVRRYIDADDALRLEKQFEADGGKWIAYD